MGEVNGGRDEAVDTVRNDLTRPRKGKESKPPPLWKLLLFLGLLGLDVILLLVLVLPIFPRYVFFYRWTRVYVLSFSHAHARIYTHTHTRTHGFDINICFVHSIGRAEDLTTPYTLHGSLWDLAFLAIPRILSAVFAVVFGYNQQEAPPETPFNPYDKYGRKKSRDELANEALEEPFLPMLKRFVLRASFPCELMVVITGILLATKCLSRLNVEIGIYGETQPQHPVLWSTLALTALLSLIESTYVESAQKLAGEIGRQRRIGVGHSGLDLLVTPLLSQNGIASVTDVENGQSNDRKSTSERVLPQVKQPVSDIGADAEHSASWKDLLLICEPDKYMILVAFIFLILSSFCEILVPKFTGAVLDSLVDHMHNNTNTSLTSIFSENPSDKSGYASIVHIPGFFENIELLVFAALLGGIFGGLRGSLFSLVGARVNARLRIRLMDSLLSQDIGFFDVTRTGEISSRLSSDTTLVGMSVTSCVNIFLRSAIMALGYLIFMATISWQLSILSFVTIPAVTVLSKWYGRYLRRLSKLQQKKLAEGSAVSESALSSMPTVRAFGAESVELTEFEKSMKDYLRLNVKSAAATLGYTTCLNSLPEIVKALVLFYGGLLVQSNGEGRISGGDLISFILYLSALSGAFNSLGGIYAMLIRAAGAADKVFELLHRQPRIPDPHYVDQEHLDSALVGRGVERILGIKSTKVIKQRAKGLYPEICTGNIIFQNVVSRYPARPERIVLNGLNLTIPAGSICALVGTSGSGKSSMVKLIQKLYTPDSGTITIDNTSISNLSLDWISRNISVVQQEPVLFARSIKRNIIYGLEGSENEPSMEEVEEAARLASAASFIEALPHGYDTEVGERGIQLSGGQKQR